MNTLRPVRIGRRTIQEDIQGVTNDSIFLIVAAVGLIPIALSYGAKPSSILTPLFGFSVESPNLTHVFRGVMGLYLAFACFWIAGALVPPLTVPALWSLIVFMFGLAAGRALSLLLDGTPHRLLVVYLVVEVVLGSVGVWLLQAGVQ